MYSSTLALLLTGWWILVGGEGRPSPLSRVLDLADTNLHVAVGWALAVVLVLPLFVAFKGVIGFARETFRIDRGDSRWWARWPRAVFDGRFARHEGHFDPGQRIANILMVGGLLVITASGIGMALLHGGPLFALLGRVHRWTTFLVTPVILGHILIAIGVLPGYRGVWRAMHLGGRVSLETARRLWPGWTERNVEGAASSVMGTRSGGNEP